MSNQWEDDDEDDFMDGDEETDMGDKPAPVSKPQTVQSSLVVQTSSRLPERGRPSHHAGIKGKRTVRVRPMPPGMMAKWPDVVSCLLTMSNGKQVMFVKGG